MNIKNFIERIFNKSKNNKEEATSTVAPAAKKSRKTTPRLGTEEFITRSKAIYGEDTFDYSKTVFKGIQRNVTLICKKHGVEFTQCALNHLRGEVACPGCVEKASLPKRLNTSKFIAASKKIYGEGAFDYSKTVYTSLLCSVILIDRKTGKEFIQSVPAHLSGVGAPKEEPVRGRKPLTTEEFISKAKEIHGDKYDYSQVEYVNSVTPVKIISREHGEFMQTPSSHLIGKGCPKDTKHRITTEDFISKAKEVHGDKYDYSQVEYVNVKTPVKIICKEHGAFMQTPSSHLSGQGCPKDTKRVVLTTEEFIRKSKKIYGPKAFDYSKVVVKGSRTPVILIDRKTGKEFMQTPANHLRGAGSPYKKSARITTEDFIAKAKEVHGDKYDYSLVKYVGCMTPVKIICKEHGAFMQTPTSHLQGHGCPKCATVKWRASIDKAIEIKRAAKEKVEK